jgi:hypothetical protein
MSKIEEMIEMAKLIEAARALGPMSDNQRREQAASFAFGQLALTRKWRDKSAPELSELRELCRKLANCSDRTHCGRDPSFVGCCGGTDDTCSCECNTCEPPA